MIDLVIHEGFHDYGQVIFYLCVLTKANNDKNPITIVFPEFLPRKDILLTVWRLSRNYYLEAQNAIGEECLVKV